MQATDTHEKLLDAALRLMLSKGYPATTVDEICAEAGVSKGSFYHFFKTKEDVGLATLAYFYQRGSGEMMSGGFSSLTDPLKRAFGFINHVEQKSAVLWREGCLLATFASELAESSPSIQAEVSRMFKDLVYGMSLLLEPIARRAKTNSPTAVEMAEMFLDVLEGSIVVARAHQEPERIAISINRFRVYLEGLVT